MSTEVNKEIVTITRLTSSILCQIDTFQSSHNEVSVEQPKNPLYASRYQRKLSFASWQDISPCNTADLVEAGFAYTGVSDRVRCYYCGLTLQKWEQGQVPIVEHAKYKPKCLHVLFMKAQEYVHKLGREEITGLDSQIQELWNTKDLMNCISVRSCLEIFRSDLVKIALYAFIAQYKTINIKSDILAQLCVYVEDNVTMPAFCSGSEVPLEHDESMRQMLEDNQIMKQSLTCKICTDRRNEMVFVPCGHFCCCQCAPLYKIRCHCGSLIDKKERALVD